MISRGLRIAFFGSSLVSTHHNCIATYYRGLVRALAHHGHTVTFYEPDAEDRQKHRDITDPTWARMRVYSATGQEAVHRAISEARNADVVIKASGIGVFDELLEAEVAEMKQRRRQVIFWDVDPAATLERLQSRPKDPLRRLIANYDMVLTCGGGEPVVRAYKELGAARCVPIYQALDPSTQFPVAADERFRGDLGFLGHCTADRQARVEEFFLKAAAELPKQSFVLGGAGWDGVALPAGVRRVGPVSTGDLNAFNSSPRAMISISGESAARIGYSPAPRLFEAIGAEACLLSDAWPGLEMFLEPEREVMVVRDGHEVAEQLRALTPRRARAIGEAARRHILTRHTYEHRATQFEALLDIGPRAHHRRRPFGRPVAQRPAVLEEAEAGLDDDE